MLPARFWSKVVRLDGCWLWSGAQTSAGYGHVWLDGRMHLAHRLTYADAHGPIPDGLEIDHLCRQTLCVRPAHLEAVTHTENVRRGAAFVTHCPHGHEYAPANTYRRPDGRRVCRTCPHGHEYAPANTYRRPDGRRVCRTCKRESDRRYRR